VLVVDLHVSEFSILEVFVVAEGFWITGIDIGDPTESNEVGIP
jgi:hypothetical protein